MRLALLQHRSAVSIRTENIVACLCRTSTRCCGHARPTSVTSRTAFTLLNHAPFFPTQGPNASARSSDSDEFILILKRASARRERPPRAARDKASVHECISNSRYLIIDGTFRLTWLANGGMRGCARNSLHRVVFFNRAQAYFGGLPRFATTNPRASATHRSRLANLSASLRSGPGGIRRASSRASTARVPQSYLPAERRVSLLIAPSDPAGSLLIAPRAPPGSLVIAPRAPAIDLG